MGVWIVMTSFGRLFFCLFLYCERVLHLVFFLKCTNCSLTNVVSLIYMLFPLLYVVCIPLYTFTCNADTAHEWVGLTLPAGKLNLQSLHTSTSLRFTPDDVTHQASNSKQPRYINTKLPTPSTKAISSLA